MSVIRAFIGIDFDQELKNEIYYLQQRLRKNALKGRWKHIDNFHLTLKFLDEINLEQKEQIDNVLRKLCIMRKPFNLSIADMGIFPGRDSIRVLWLGFTGDILQLHTLQHEVDEAMVPIGFRPEKRRYTPHITIGQDIVFSGDFGQIRESIGKFQFRKITVNGLVLFKSEQVQHKRIYTKASEYELLR